MHRRLLSTLLTRALLGSRLGAMAVFIAACSSSRSTWTPCVIFDAGTLSAASFDAASLNLVDNSSCPVSLRCVEFATVGQDGMCHAIGQVCTVPCRTDSDCSGLGVNTVCSRACGSAPIDPGVQGGVCTPFQ